MSRLLPIVAGVIFVLVIAVKVWPLALLMAIVVIAGLGWQQISKGKVARSKDIKDQLDLETRTLYSGLRRTMFELEEALESSRAKSTSRVLVTETQQELESLRLAVDRAALTRSELKKHLKERLVLTRETEELQRSTSTAPPETQAKVKAVLDTAAGQEDISLQAERAIRAIDGQLESAKVAVQLMKSKFAQGSLEASLANSEGDELRNSLAELKAMSRSFDEVEQLGNLSD